MIGCTIITTSKKDHNELSERIVELDSMQKDYYQVSIEVSNDFSVDRYNYMYLYNDVTDTYYSDYKTSNIEYKYVFHHGLVSTKISSNNSEEEQEFEMTFEEYKNNYVSPFGSKYIVDLQEASYKREEIFFSFSSTSYLKNIFVFKHEYDYHINLFDLEIVISEITVEFESIKNKSDSTFFDEFTIRGKDNGGYTVTIVIFQ